MMPMHAPCHCGDMWAPAPLSGPSGARLATPCSPRQGVSLSFFASLICFILFCMGQCPGEPGIHPARGTSSDRLGSLPPRALSKFWGLSRSKRRVGERSPSTRYTCSGPAERPLAEDSPQSSNIPRLTHRPTQHVSGASPRNLRPRWQSMAYHKSTGTETRGLT